MSVAKLGESLVAKGLISQEQLNSANDHKTKTKGRLASSLVKLGFVTEKVLATFLAKQYGLTAISLEDVEVPMEVTKLVPQTLCEKHGIVPLALEGNKIAIAVSDPTNVAAVDDVRFLSNLDVDVYLSTETGIRRLTDKAYANSVKDFGKAVQTELNKADEGNPAVVDVTAVSEAHDVEGDRTGDKPIIRVMNKILMEAIKRKGSDIHIEPFETQVVVRVRQDGSLHELMKLPPQLKNALPARVKVMSKLDITEKRLPQDGRIQAKLGDRKVDIRVSILPTVYGEKVVMRILDAGSSTPDLRLIGFEEEQLKLFEKASSQPYGMILVTGPTGSGKSTTLFAALGSLNTPDVNISTVEDPVEYNMAGINQVQMKESIGLTFAAALRSLLRQDPDIVMVGEIRDQETAEIAIKAALTGHLVFSTLHTNDAPSTVTRLIHMGIEPFLITAALTLVQAQRLIRVNCENCLQEDTKVTKDDLRNAEMPDHWMDSVKPMRGVGCDICAGTGFRGRRGIFEVMYLSERIREMIIKGANADELRKTALEDGMITLRQSGLLKVYRGETVLEEILNNSRPDRDFK